MSEEYYSDYPTEPIGGSNPYHRCSHCGASVPAINGRLEGHYPNCEYRLKKQAELRQQARSAGKPTLATLSIETNFSLMLTDKDGDDFSIGHEYLFENIHKGQIVQEVLQYLDAVEVTGNLANKPLWEATRDQFKQRLLACYVEHTSTKPLDDLLFCEQVQGDIHIELQFSH